MGSIWENNQLLLKVGMIMQYSSRYLFGKKTVCKCIYHKSMSIVWELGQEEKEIMDGWPFWL